MRADVGERLLHDPVRRERQPAGQGLDSALHLVADARAGLAGLGHQLCYVGHGGSRGERRRLRTGAQDPEQAAHLRQGLTAGAADLGQGLARLRGCGIKSVGAPVGLRHHDAEVVRDHVVQLAGDTGALGRGGDLRLGIPFPFGADGAFLQPGEVGAPVPDQVAERPGAHRSQEIEHADQEEELHRVHSPLRSRVPPRDRSHEQRHARGQGRQRDSPGPFGRDGVEQDQDAEVGKRGLQRAFGELCRGADGHLSGTDREPGGEGRYREAPANRYRAGQREADQQGSGAGEEGFGASGQQEERQCPVHEPRMTAQPGVDPFHGPRVAGLAPRRRFRHRGG